MKIQLITIGNELLNGKIRDKNAYWLAKFCHEHNLAFQKNHIIPDDADAFNKAMAQAWEDADLVVTSGGLGPTKDDLTKAMIAKFFDKELVESDQAMDIVKRNYQKSNREYNPQQEYSKIPQDFEAVYNETGYAPGLLFVDQKKMAAVLPGVPSEFNHMFTEEIFPRAKEFLSVKAGLIKHVIVKTWRAPEAKIFNSICPGLWEELEVYGQVSSLPHSLGVDIGVRVEGPDEKKLSEIERKILEVVNASALKEYIWHIGKESLEEVIVARAKEKNMTIGFAESCTGGLCASRITDVPGCSDVFIGSIVSYSNSAKESVLNLNASTLEKYGAVSKETAWEMAQGARNALGADLVVTTTGIAGPGGGSAEKPVGTVAIGYSSERDCASDLHCFTKRERLDMKQVFSQIALFTMLEQIELFERTLQK